MKKKLENVLIFGATSDIARLLINKLLKDKVSVYAVSRSVLNLEHPWLFKYNVDLTNDIEIDNFFKNLPDIKFDAILNFQGVAISSPVEKLKKDELKRQLDISLFSLLNILKNSAKKIDKKGVVVAISSMASFGIYPFLAPYSIAKQAADTLLGCFEMETGIKTVSIKPGVIGTKFWKFCVKENEKNFEQFSGEYEIIGKFLKQNSLNNSNKGLKPDYASKQIYKIIYKKHPKASYLIGTDSKIAGLASLFKGRFLFKLIRKILNNKIKRFLNG